MLPSAQAVVVGIERVEDDVVVMPHGHYRSVIEVGGTGFDLRGDEEQDALLAGYGAFLNGLSFPVQLIVRVLPVDVERYLGDLERRAAGAPDQVAELARDHTAFVRRLARHRSLLERRFFVVVPASDQIHAGGAPLPRTYLRPPWSSPTRRRDETAAAAAAAGAAHRQLRARCDEVERQLGRCGLRARRLRGAELARLYYSCWCPELAGVQRLDRHFAEHTAPVVRGVGDGGRVAGAPAPSPRDEGDARTDPVAAAQREPSTSVSAAVSDAARRFALGTRSLADLIAPGAVEIARSHVRLDHQYARALVVTGYPRTVAPGWLAPLIDFDAPLEISLHVQPLDSAQMVRALSHRLVQLHSSRLLEARGGRLPDPEREVAYEDLERLRDALQRGDEHAFSVSLYVLVRADSLPALDDLTRRVESTLDGMLATSRVAVLEQDAGFRSCLPVGQDRLGVYRNLDTASLATAFPFTSSGLAMERGVLCGLAAHNHSPVIVDPFDDGLKNANAVVFAKSGAGKSYFTKLLALRNLLVGTDFIVIDPENEYRALCRHVGGQYVRLSSASGQRLNPFDLPPSTSDMGDGDGGHVDPLSEQIAALLGLLEVMLGRGGGGGSVVARADAESLDSHERAVLDRALYETYAAVGITTDPATHDRPAPLLRDLLAALEATAGDVAAGLATRLRRFVAGSLAGLFAGPTNVALDGRLVVFDTQALEPELRPIGIHLITTFIWNQVRRRRRPRLLIIDEAWTLLQYPQGGAFVAGMARRARKYHLGLVTITQDVADFLHSEHGRTVLSNASLKLLMKQDSTTIGPVVEAFGLSAEERQFLLAAEKGQGLLFARGTRLALKVEASPLEHRLATTAPRELAAVEGVVCTPAHTGASPAAPAAGGASAPAPEPRRQLGLPLAGAPRAAPATGSRGGDA